MSVLQTSKRGVVAAIVVAIGAFITTPASAEETITQTITHVLYNAEADYAFFIGPARWGAPGCPNAYYVQVPASVPGRKQLLSLATAAKMSNARVTFYGTCAEPNYFNAMYIIVQ